MSAVFKAGHTAVITGGASGIGLSLAKKCHGHGMKVLVVDRDEETLSAASENVGGPVSTFLMDVSKLDDWARLKKKVQEEFGGKVNFLALNAGIIPKSSFEDVSTFHDIMDTNFFGVVNGINTFLPLVKESAPSAIVMTTAKRAITNPPGHPAYNASKAALNSVAEQLSYDLRDVEGVSVHLLMPGMTFTGLAGNRPGGSPKEKPAGAWWPDQSADYLEKKMAEGQFYVICPDNTVTEELDRTYMLWSATDVTEGRPPLSRWREDWKDKAQEWIASKQRE